MSAYAIVRATITDAERFKDYVARTPALLEKYGAKFLARGGDVVTLEGDAENRRICLLYTSPSPRDATLSRMPSSA